MAEQSGLQFTISVEGLDNGTLRVVGFEGHEALSEPFGYQLELASRDETLTAVQVVDQPVTLTIWQDGEVQQTRYGIASSFTKGDTGFHFTRYKLTLVPALSRLALRQNSRIFQQQTAQQVISIRLQEMGINDYAFALSDTHQPREYCVQYRETDLAFIERLAAEEGIYYYFIHDAGKHTVVFTDNTQQAPLLGQPWPYNATAGGQATEPFVRAFTHTINVAPASVQLKDYSFKKPAYSFLQTAQGSNLEAQQQIYEHYDYPGRYKSDEQGIPFTQYRIESLRRQSDIGRGESNIPQLVTGFAGNLTDHLDESCNRSWLLVAINHQGTQPQSLEEAGGDGVTSYNNQFTVIPSDRPWRPVQNPKPCVDGPQIGMIVGPEDEEIYCDEYGRVKVQFPWDRYGNGDDVSSCWIRVSQEWAGSQFGGIAIPRIGHEVIVSFLEGDPDQPIITGRTYHATNQPPYPLPENKTRTVLRTHTHKGEGYNELRFEDLKDQEEIYIHGQKDMNTRIENDRKADIGRDNHLTVERNQFSKVLGDDHYTVDGESRIHVKGMQTQYGESSKHVKSAALLNQTARELHLNGGIKITLEASASITFKVGGSFLTIDGSGVSASGPKVKMNSGGSASNGTPYGGNIAKLPIPLAKGVANDEVAPIAVNATETSQSALLKAPPAITPAQAQPEQPQPPQTVAINNYQQRQAMVTAAKKGKPVCQACEEAKKHAQ